MIFILLLVLLFSGLGQAQPDLLREAERLDSERKCDEAEQVYERALNRGPGSVPLLNNLGNHYLLCGKPEKARASFESVLRLNPRHGNANLQLARIAAGRHEGKRALDYLAHIDTSSAAMQLLLAEAEYWAGRKAEALKLIDAAKPALGADERLLYLYGLTCARMEAYDRAETAFQQLLNHHPEDFDLLFNMGRAAARARHFDRAQRALDVSLRLRPDDVDVLTELGQVSAALQDYTRAVFLLARAKQAAGGRPEVTLALAQAALSGGYYGDAAIAFDEYVARKPTDDAAKRDRALACGLTATRQEEGRRELIQYVATHPKDPFGYYSLAQLTWRTQPEEAVSQLAKAIELDGAFAAAHVNTAWLLNRLGRAEEALPHLRKAIELSGADVRTLDQLGLTYQALDRLADAEKALRQAMEKAPDDADVWMHLGRVLMEEGRQDEGQELLARFQKTGPARTRTPWRSSGMIESATLTAGERARRDIERLRREVTNHPDDLELQLRLGSLLQINGDTEHAQRIFRELLARNADARICHDAGTVLLGFEQYELANEFLQRAAAGRPSAYLDLAMAVVHLHGAEKALSVLEHVPDADRSAEFWVVKANLLDIAGNVDQSEKALAQGLSGTTVRPDVARQGALVLLRHDRKKSALALLDRTSGHDPEAMLLKAVVLALLGENSRSESLLRQVELEWPELERAYLIHGLLLERTKPGEAVRKLRTARGLGANGTATRCAMARLGGGAANENCSCARDIQDLLFPNCGGR